MKRPLPAKLLGSSAQSQVPLPALVIEAIKGAIRDGQLKAGQRLRERDVGEWLGVSRTPVREAFRMLQAQGLLADTQGDGVLIKTLERDEVAELYRTWADLEAISARDAAMHSGPADIQRLNEICGRWHPRLSPEELGILNRNFHDAICAAAHNRYLTKALESIDDVLALLGINTYTLPGRPAEAGREHKAIVAAIAKRDAQAAFAAAKAHIERAGELRMGLMLNQL